MSAISRDSSAATNESFAPWRGKRLLDVAGAITAVMLFSPFMALIALGLLYEGGSVIFMQERIGRNGIPFKVFKFRSMVPNAGEVLEKLLESDPAAAEEFRTTRKLLNDPRITTLGRIIRKTSMDELPQLFNVLRGEMSLVGPRPVPAVEMSFYGRGSRYYTSVRPGITGLWQVSGRNDVSYERRVALDRRYVVQQSLWLDVKILLATVSVVLFGTGAY